MLLDKTGNPLPPEKSLIKATLNKIKSIGKGGKTLILALTSVTILLLNFNGIIDLYERIRGKKAYPIEVVVSNISPDTLQVHPLLNYYITTHSRFHTGRLLAGDIPTGRLELMPVPDSSFSTPFTFEPGETVVYTTEITPYGRQFQDGGQNIVFVLRANTRGFNLQEYAFHPVVLEVLSLHFNLES